MVASLLQMGLTILKKINPDFTWLIKLISLLPIMSLIWQLLLIQLAYQPVASKITFSLPTQHAGTGTWIVCKAYWRSKKTGCCSMTPGRGLFDAQAVPYPWWIEIMKGFQEATNITQGELVVTSSLVISCIQGLRNHIRSSRWSRNSNLVEALNHYLERQSP